MLKTAIPVSEYQLSRMLRELPRTSKNTSPSRGSGAASDPDMLPNGGPQPGYRSNPSTVVATAKAAVVRQSPQFTNLRHESGGVRRFAGTVECTAVRKNLTTRGRKMGTRRARATAGMALLIQAFLPLRSGRYRRGTG
jgi:hypothetical protein